MSCSNQTSFTKLLFKIQTEWAELFVHFNLYYHDNLQVMLQLHLILFFEVHFFPDGSRRYDRWYISGWPFWTFGQFKSESKWSCFCLHKESHRLEKLSHLSQPPPPVTSKRVETKMLTSLGWKDDFPVQCHAGLFPIFKSQDGPTLLILILVKVFFLLLKVHLLVNYDAFSTDT